MWYFRAKNLATISFSCLMKAMALLFCIVNAVPSHAKEVYLAQEGDLPFVQAIGVPDVPDAELCKFFTESWSKYPGDITVHITMVTSTTKLPFMTDPDYVFPNMDKLLGPAADKLKEIFVCGRSVFVKVNKTSPGYADKLRNQNVFIVLELLPVFNAKTGGVSNTEYWVNVKPYYQTYNVDRPWLKFDVSYFAANHIDRNFISGTCVIGVDCFRIYGILSDPKSIAAILSWQYGPEYLNKSYAERLQCGEC